MEEDQLDYQERSQLLDAPSFLRHSWSGIQNQTRSSMLDIRAGCHTILFCGCGDSHHAAHSLQYAAASFLGASTRGLHSMEAARYWIPNHADKNSLVIGISASGAVARTIEAIEQAKRKGSWTIGVTAKPGSDLAQVADQCIHNPLPDYGPTPGLLSYLASLMMGFAVISWMASIEISKKISISLTRIFEALPDWISHQQTYAERIAGKYDHRLPLLFLASGPAFGSAQFSAAKFLEATGGWSWPQDIEEWAHLEYFCEPAQFPIWCLSTSGRASSREAEVLEAARAIGRSIFQSKWGGVDGFTDWENEIYSPLMLWAGPYAFSTAIMSAIGQTPFRGFSGGRSVEEGGGASRIQSSWRVEEDGEWRPKIG
jgi:glucosamine--fructose-6-phosphate aminotransferase (isomerizing)